MLAPPILHRAVLEPHLPASEPHIPGAGEEGEERAVLKDLVAGKWFRHTYDNADEILFFNRKVTP
jgi:hypothetical protein